MEAREMRIGPLRRNWSHDQPPGDCAECGGDCDGPDCGRHAAGCIYGGGLYGEGGAYWLIVGGCPRWHGEGE